jgi:hypothetical protein
MLDPTFHELQLPADLEDAGHAYGRACAALLHGERLDRYLHSMMALKRTDAESLALHAAAWARRLPAHYRRQMHAMADGAAVTVGAVERFLYADIAVPAGTPVAEGRPMVSSDGPMCSGVVVHEPDPWVARNCDWYEATLQRGTAAVFHRVPHRIPCVALGLMGDIDADTGMNAEGLWLHVHTLQAADEPRAGVSCISWLFWMREALETCATLDDVERFIARTDRDRGVLLFAADGRRGQSAIFECSRSAYRAVEPSSLAGRPALAATNHVQAKHPPADEALERGLRSTGNGTVSRWCRLHASLARGPSDAQPQGLIALLSDEGIEMRPGRGSEALRTIYSAVAAPARGAMWFASGACPAASAGTWRLVRAEWR